MEQIKYIAGLIDSGFRVIHHGGKYCTINGRKFDRTLLVRATYYRYLLRCEKRKNASKPE